MVAIPLAHRFADRNDALGLCAWRLAGMAVRLVAWWRFGRCQIAQLTQLGLKRALDPLGLRRRELVFERENAMGPGGESVYFVECRQFRDQSLSKVVGGFRRQS